jgi:hypothetical protein
MFPLPGTNGSGAIGQAAYPASPHGMLLSGDRSTGRKGACFAAALLNYCCLRAGAFQPASPLPPLPACSGSQVGCG